MANVSLVDGGEDGQSIPLVPLLQPSRQLDFILAIDSGTDTPKGWPAGYSLFATFVRYGNRTIQGAVPMPYIPFSLTFVNEGLNTRPTFFGCNSTTDVANATNFDTKAPIIAYVPNYPWTYLSNYSTGSTQLYNNQSQPTIDNGFQSATMAGITSGSSIDWPLCLACASLQRSFERSNTPVPAKCQECMSQYCWSGTSNDTVPSVDYSPTIGTPEWVKDGAAQTMTTASGAASLSISATLLALALFITSLYLLK
jgi:lysophospholipase